MTGSNNDEYQWLTVFVDVVLDGITASYREEIEKSSFTNFLELLKKSLINNSQVIVFKTIEDYISINGRYCDSNEVKWNIKLQHLVGNGSILD